MPTPRRHLDPKGFFMDHNTPSDKEMIRLYESNGLFAAIIDKPSDEAIRSGFTIEGIKDRSIVDYCTEELDFLGWDSIAANAIRWARLLGGALAVLLVNDGRGIDEPLDMKHARSIDAIRLYDRSLIQPNTVIHPTPTPESTEPEYFDVFSKYGTFRVHASRCLTFHNGIMPENAATPLHELWGVPEYTRIAQSLLNTELAYSNALRLLNAAGQGLYKIKDLGAKSATEEGYAQIKQQMELMDLTRGMLNSIAVDGDEKYSFFPVSFSGVADVIAAAQNHLSAVTRIPQIVLFGTKTVGFWDLDVVSLENWYNYVGAIQTKLIKKNLYRLLTILLQCGINQGIIRDLQSFQIHFAPLWSISELEMAKAAHTRAATQFRKAEIAQAYVNIGAIAPSEVRRGLAKNNDFDIATLIDREEILT